MFVTTERFMTKPCWLELKCSAKCLFKSIYRSFSQMLLIKLRSDTGQYLSTFRLSPFLITGDTAADFHLIGNFLWCFIFLKILFRVTAVCLPVLWKKIGGRPSAPLIYFC